MHINLTQKERLLLEDQKKHEELCIEKYTSYAQHAQDPELKQLFRNYAAQEQHHLDLINQLLSGTIPQMQQGQRAQAASRQAGQGGTAMPHLGAGTGGDAALCQDLLMTEKYVSGTYDTAVFEFTDPRARQVLNHIQKEEQEHGEGIFNYMQSRGMYNPR